MNIPVIAIDGPSASGKGTIAKRVAQTLGFHYLESGALYRLVALLALRQDLEDETRLAEAAENMDVDFLGEEIILEDQEGSQHIRHEAGGHACRRCAGPCSPGSVHSAVLRDWSPTGATSGLLFFRTPPSRSS